MPDLLEDRRFVVCVLDLGLIELVNIAEGNLIGERAPVLAGVRLSRILAEFTDGSAPLREIEFVIHFLIIILISKSRFKLFEHVSPYERGLPMDVVRLLLDV